MSNCCCFYILILLCGNIIGHSSIIFLKYFIRFLCCNWYFYNVFVLLKESYSNVEQTARHTGVFFISNQCLKKNNCDKCKTIT